MKFWDFPNLSKFPKIFTKIQSLLSNKKKNRWKILIFRCFASTKQSLDSYNSVQKEYQYQYLSELGLIWTK